MRFKNLYTSFFTSKKLMISVVWLIIFYIKNKQGEVQNAYEAYEIMSKLNPYSVKDLLKAHKIMMEGQEDYGIL